METAARTSGLKYATSFDEKILGVGCDVEVVVDVQTGDASATVAMRQFLRSSPAFRITSNELAAFAEAVSRAKQIVGLLDSKVSGAEDHQLNYSSGGASLIIVHPLGKPARYVITIGMFNQEGEIEKLSSSEIDAAVKRVSELIALVREKVTSKKK